MSWLLQTCEMFLRRNMAATPGFGSLIRSHCPPWAGAQSFCFTKLIYINLNYTGEFSACWQQILPCVHLCALLSSVWSVWKSRSLTFFDLPASIELSQKLMIHCWFMRTVCVESLVNRGAADGTATDCSKVWLKELTHVDTFKTVWIYPVQKSWASTAAQSADLRFSRCACSGNFSPDRVTDPQCVRQLQRDHISLRYSVSSWFPLSFLLISLWVFEINRWMLKAKECLDSSHCFSCVFLWAYQFQFQVSCRVVRLKNEVMEDSEEWWRYVEMTALASSCTEAPDRAKSGARARGHRDTGQQVNRSQVLSVVP